MFCFLYVFTNLMFIASLRFISNTEAATFLATDPALCFLFAFLCLGANCQPTHLVKNVVQFVAAMMSVAAITMGILGAEGPPSDMFRVYNRV